MLLIIQRAFDFPPCTERPPNHPNTSDLRPTDHGQYTQITLMLGRDTVIRNELLQDRQFALRRNVMRSVDRVF